MNALQGPILVVDDHASSRYAKARMLQRAGFEVVEADNGALALQLLASRRPRLVVLDVNLPDIDGFELCRRVKEDPGTASTVVLQVSATYVEHSDTVRALDGGADASLVEPIDATVLVATVRALLRARQAEDALRDALAREQQARAAAESANRVKDDFLATLSHELRTPLGAILTWATLLRTGTPDPEQAKRGLEAIERNTRLQAKLVEDLLDVSRIISGKMQLEIARVDLKSVIGSAVDAIAPAAAAKEVKLGSQFAEDLPAIDADPGRLQQIASNLLSNGIKFTPAGGRVDISVAASGGEVEIRVSDTGRGIAPEFLPHVFERFQQADSSTTRSEAGLGLGLAIVRHLVLAHGGSVHAESEGLGRGARFSIRLPVASEHSRRALAAASAASRGPLPSRRDATLAGLRVLVVDDDVDSREANIAALARTGAQVSSAGSVREALARIAEGPIDVVVSDIGMPDEDGFELIRELRACPKDSTARIAAVALTAFASVEDERRALASGYDAFLAKPADVDALLDLIVRLTRPGRS
jgi:signal transduction histidine kinase